MQKHASHLKYNHTRNTDLGLIATVNFQVKKMGKKWKKEARRKQWSK